MLICEISNAQFFAQSLVTLCTAIFTITIPIIYEAHMSRKERKREILEKMYGELLASMDFVVHEYSRYNNARAQDVKKDNENRWEVLHNAIMPYVYKAQVILSQAELIFKEDDEYLQLQKKLEDTFSAYVKQANAGESSAENYHKCKKQFEEEIKKRINDN
mgnify:CR=1 FL=1